MAGLANGLAPRPQLSSDEKARLQLAEGDLVVIGRWDFAADPAISPEMAFLTRVDPGRNIDRFYIVNVTPTLFGEWAVLREWGQRGSPGTMRLDTYRRRDDAQIAEQRTIKRRLQHGYTERTVCLSSAACSTYKAI
jgi:predicted DNA-binding WGR domain protein